MFLPFLDFYIGTEPAPLLMLGADCANSLIDYYKKVKFPSDRANYCAAAIFRPRQEAGPRAGCKQPHSTFKEKQPGSPNRSANSRELEPNLNV